MNLMQNQTENYNRVAIKGYEGLYEIDENGGVYSIAIGKSRRTGKLKPYLNNSGYLRVNLYDRNGKAHKYYVHRLVAEHFLKKETGCHNVDHKDCNKLNNNANNLEWITQKENIRRSLVNGLQNTYTCIVDGVKYVSMREASKTIFNNSWIIRHQRRKQGNEFIYNNHKINIVEK